MSEGSSSKKPQPPSDTPSDIASMSKAELVDFINGLRLQDSETQAPDPADEPPNWLEQEIGSAPLWIPEKDYKGAQLCMNCMVTVALLAKEYEKRGGPEFRYTHLHEVNTLYHILPAKMRDPYTPNDIMKEAIAGCPLCSMAIGASWMRGDLPYDTARWAKNPLYRKRAQCLYYNMHRPDWDLDKFRPMLQIIFGTELSTEPYPEKEMPEAWGAIHLWDGEQLQKWYQEEGYPYKSQETLDETPKPSLKGFTGDPEVLDMAKWWLKRCLAEHTECSDVSKQVDAGQAPARLLCVDSAEEPETIKLVDADATNLPEYVTLSYCWGKKPFIQLTSKTLASFQESIEISALPPTLRDAIAVTKALGYSYIWIDALCIIQDSKEDWLQQAAKMGSVYRRSVLTIAALGATDSFQGLFTSRNPYCWRDITLYNDFMFTNRAPAAGHSFKREFDVLGEAASPLQTRAWCVQEQLLSPRTLYFGASGIFWQCHECEADEGHACGTRTSHENLKAAVTKAIATGAFDLRKTWRDILQRYTGCHLTYASDKLVAISGIANLIARASGDEYVAGLWNGNKDIFHDLLWHSQDAHWTGNRNLGRLKNNCPTFSWASVSQAINYFKYNSPKTTHLDAKALAVECNTNKDGPEYRLRLTTQLREVVLLPPAYTKTGCPQLVLADAMPFPSDPTWSDDAVSNAVLIRIQERVRLDWTFDMRLDEDIDTSHLNAFAYDWLPDIPLDGAIRRAWFMCVARYDERDPLGAAGLVVVPVDEARSAWRRIGFLTHSGFFSSIREAGLRITVQNSATSEIDWEETAKHRAPNPFLLDPERECVEVVLV